MGTGNQAITSVGQMRFFVEKFRYQKYLLCLLLAILGFISFPVQSQQEVINAIEVTNHNPVDAWARWTCLKGGVYSSAREACYTLEDDVWRVTQFEEPTDTENAPCTIVSNPDEPGPHSQNGGYMVAICTTVLGVPKSCARTDENGRFFCASVEWKCPSDDWMLAPSNQTKCIRRPVCNPAIEKLDPKTGKCIPLIPCSSSQTRDADGICQCASGMIKDPANAMECIVPSEEPDECEPSTSAPITIGTGNKWLIEDDFRGVGALPYTRTYNSEANVAGSVLGARWRMSYDQRIDTDSGRENYWVSRSNGRSYAYTASGGSGNSGATRSFVASPHVNYKMVSDTEMGYRVFTQDQALESYSSDGRLMSRRLSTGVTIVFLYNSDNRLSKVSDSFGRTLAFTYDGSGRIRQVVAQPGGTVNYGYDDKNNLNKVTYPDGRTKIYHYEDSRFPHALTGITDESGIRQMTYTYDTQGRANSEYSTAVSGVNRYNLIYNGDTTKVVDPLNSSRTYQFTKINNIIKSTGQSQPGGSGCGPTSLSKQYDANGNLKQHIDFNGNITTYTYDMTRNLETKRVEASGKSEQRTFYQEWHDYWRMPVRTSEPNKITTYVYNGDTYNGSTIRCSSGEVMRLDGNYRPNGVLCKKIEQATTDDNGNQAFNANLTGTPRIWDYAYNYYGQMTLIDGPRTDVEDKIKISYSANLPVKISYVIDPFPYTIDIQNHSLGIPRIIIYNGDLAGLLSFNYDNRGNLTSQTLGKEKTDFEYNAVGQITKIIQPDGSYIVYTYDDAHRLTDITDAQGNRIHYTLDVMGNRVKEDISDSQGELTQTRQRIYDALNRLSQDIGANNQIIAYEYDANGNQTQVTGPLNQSTTYTFDALNRLIKSIDPNNGQTQVTWNGQNRVIQITDPRNLKTIYTIDGLGNQTKLQSPDTGVTSRTFDAAGNILTQTDAKNQTTSYKYDVLNRLTQVMDHAGNLVKYTYDMNPYGTGRLSKIEELESGVSTLTINYTYDPVGRLLTEQRNVKKAGNTAWLTHTQAYTYSNGRLSSMTLPSGRKLTYQRDTTGQINQVTMTDIAPNAGAQKIVASQIEYHPFGGIKRWTDGAGQIHQRAIDKDGRTASYSLGSNAWQLSYDAGSRIIAQMDTKNATQSISYGYDNLDRLTGAQLPNISYSYGYDATGNRTSQLMGSASQTHAIDQASNRITATTGNQPRTYAYDLTGNLTSDGQITNTYDVRGRLQQASTAAGAATYRINALGQRIQKTAAGNDSWYHYDQAGQLVAESDSTGKVTREYLWLGNTPIAVVQ